MKHALSISALLVTLLSLSCSETKSGDNTKTFNYQLVKTDSIRVNSLEQIQITDYSSQKNTFLAYATRTKTCMEVDFKGNIISTVDLTGEGPGHFGQGITELGYLGDDIIINGPFMYLTYDGDWNFKERIPYQSGGAFLPLGMITGAPESQNHSENPVVIRTIDHNYFGSKKLADDYFHEAKMIELIPLNEEEPIQLFNYPEESIYRSESIYFDAHKARVSYNSTNETFDVVLPLEPRLYIFDSKTNNLLQTYQLDLNSFKKPQGIPFEDQHKNGRSGFGPSNQLNTVYNLTNSMVYNISSEGNITILEYTTGTKGETNLTDIKSASALNQKEAQRFTAFFKSGKKIAEVEKRFTKLVRLDEYRFLVHDVNQEEELDYSQFFIYELKEIN